MRFRLRVAVPQALRVLQYVLLDAVAFGLRVLQSDFQVAVATVTRCTVLQGKGANARKRLSKCEQLADGS